MTGFEPLDRQNQCDKSIFTNYTYDTRDIECKRCENTSRLNETYDLNERRPRRGDNCGDNSYANLDWLTRKAA